MSKKPTITIVITTYNRISALRLVLSHLTRQSDKDFDVIVADDGSDEKTLNAVKQFSTKLLIDHVWHEDNGFRASKIRNKAVARAKGDYLIFLDGDCVPLTHFVRNHRRLAEKNWLVTGNRVLFSNHYTKSIEKREMKFDQWSFMSWLNARLKRRCNRLLPFVTLPLGIFRKLKKRTWEGVKTCNLGVWKADFLSVNGFNEEYEGWGFEDSDLVIRLYHQGIKRKSGRYSIPVLHLWHPENDRSSKDENFSRLQRVQQSNVTRASLGVDQYIEA